MHICSHTHTHTHTHKPHTRAHTRARTTQHFNFTYFDSLNSTRNDVQVDVLGGFTGIAYRSGFFDLSRLTDYKNYPVGSFYVDDDWISGCLDDSGIPRIVLSNLTSPETANFLFNTDVVTHVSNIYSLNGLRMFRNRRFQGELLAFLREREGRFQTSGNLVVQGGRPPSFLDVVYDVEYYGLLDMRR